MDAIALLAKLEPLKQEFPKIIRFYLAASEAGPIADPLSLYVVVDMEKSQPLSSFLVKVGLTTTALEDPDFNVLEEVRYGLREVVEEYAEFVRSEVLALIGIHPQDEESPPPSPIVKPLT